MGLDIYYYDKNEEEHFLAEISDIMKARL